MANEYLESPRAIETLWSGLEHPARLALGLFALTETLSWPLAGLAHALRSLGVEPIPAVRRLAELGLLSMTGEPEGERGIDLTARLEDQRAGLILHPHPAALTAARTVLPTDGLPVLTGPVRQVREADGLEPVLRLAALWQRVDEVPLRQTQQGTLYKRDRDRLEDDPVLAGPIADALEPLPDMAALWLAVARAVGLVVAEAGGERAVAARPEYWAENAVHLPQMIATGWLGLRHWHEQGGMRHEPNGTGAALELALPYLRPAILLWLATAAPEQWVALDDLAAHLRRLSPRWDRTTLGDEPPEPPPRGRSGRGGVGAGRSAGSGAAAAPPGLGAGVLEALLLGAAYQLGLVRAAEEAATGRRLVQLSHLGRYVLALGPPPPPRPAFDQFLFVQPNFEIIAYRQGLNPVLIGGFSRFAHWVQIGAALELKLTPESVYRGLEGGLTEPAILERLQRHSARPLPASVAEALRTWSDRRRRITYHAAATLIEFASRSDLEQCLALWPAESPPPARIAPRLLLVEDESAIPFQRFRLAGSRDYRRAPEACLDVEPDGVTLALDLARSDLLIDAELERLAEEQPAPQGAVGAGAPGNPRRHFLVTPASLARAFEHGMTPALLAHWYVKRTGAQMPPAVRLLLLAAPNRAPGRSSALEAERILVLRTASPEWLDGLFQHPATRDYLGERLGPTTAVLPEALVGPLRRALAALGLTLEIDSRDG
jgi:hypothetical protein